jgi:hypothetical protein
MMVLLLALSYQDPSQRDPLGQLATAVQIDMSNACPLLDLQ